MTMSDAIVHLDDENFANETASGITLVDFHADWCGPCRMMSPIIEDLAEEMKGKVKIAKVDIEKAKEVTASFEVTSIPTVILFKDGKEVSREVGLKDADSLKKMIASSE